MRRQATVAAGWFALLLLGAALQLAALAQQAGQPVVPENAASADRGTALPVPFGPGEVFTYVVKLGIFPVGESSLQVSAIEPIRGIQTYHLEWRIKGGIPFYQVDTRMQSWIDVERLVSLRFIQDQHEGSYTRFRELHFFPEQRRWKRVDNGEEGSLATSLPLDDVSFIYFARSLELEVGKEYRFNRYFKESGNPVVVKVLRRDEREVPAGTFKTIVLQPTIQTTGLFGEGGEAELHLSDDPARILVYLRTEMPGISLTLHLKSVGNGIPIAGDARNRAAIPRAPHQ